MGWTEDVQRVTQITKDGAEPIPTRDTMSVEGACDLRDNPTSGASELVLAPYSGTRVSSPNALTGNTHNWTYSALSKSDLVRASATGDLSITGMVMSTSLIRWKVLLNSSEHDITLSHESSSSQPQNRFLTETGEDVEIPPNGWVFLLFDEVSQRIRVLRIASGGAEVPVGDHGDLTGLLNDDHTIYILVNGSRAFTGNQSMGGNRLTSLGAPSASADAVRLQDLNDHDARHLPGGADPLATAAAVSLSAATTNAEGNAASFARSNHTHALDVATGTLSTINAGDAAVDGTAAGIARRDHQHAVATAAPSTGIGGGNTEGVSTALARADHNHKLRETSGPTDLTIGAVADGQYLVRSGTTIVGTSSSPGGGVALTNNAPVDVTKATAAVGVSTEAARADHKHDASTAAAVGLNAGSTNAEGNATSLARSNHTHALDVTTGTLATINAGDAAVDGTAIGLARRDHQHPVATAAAVGLSGTTSNAEGASTSLARADHTHAIATGVVVSIGTANSAGSGANLALANHVHDHGAQTTEGHHALTSSTAAGFQPRSNRTATTNPGAGNDNTQGYALGSYWVNQTSDQIFFCVDASTAAAVWTSPGAVTAHASTHAPGAGDALPTAAAVSLSAATTNAEGAGAAFARNNHTHAIDVATGTIATINAGDAAVDGTAAGLARRDHQHPVATAAAVGLSGTTANAEGASTSLARADHTHAIATGAPVAIGTANGAGSGANMALANHVHDHGAQTTEGHHALVSSTAAGFQPRSNRAATTNPTVNEDSGDGYGVGSYWVNTTTDVIYFCTDAAVGAAVWVSPSAVTAHASTHLPSGSDPLTTAAAVSLSGDTTNTTGAANSLARSNHTHLIDTTTGAIATLTAGASSATGTAAGLSRRDHVHAISTAAAVGLNAGSTNTEGAATSFARSNHTHQLDVTTGTLSTINAGDTAVDGTAIGLARRDHQHPVATAAAVGIGTGNAEGASSSLSRADHVHDHGAQTVETHHNLVSSALAGFQPRSHRGAGTDPSTGHDSAAGFAVGSYWVNTTADRWFKCVDASLGAAIWHRITPGGVTPLNIGITAAEGTSTTPARADHVHEHGIQLGGGLHVLTGDTSFGNTHGFQPKSNRFATTDPAVGDDVADGYQVGSYWVNTTTWRIWQCTVNSLGAAVWIRTSRDFTQTTTYASARTLDMAFNDNLIVRTPMTGNITITLQNPVLNVSQGEVVVFLPANGTPRNVVFDPLGFNRFQNSGFGTAFTITGSGDATSAHVFRYRCVSSDSSHTPGYVINYIGALFNFGS